MIWCPEDICGDLQKSQTDVDGRRQRGIAGALQIIKAEEVRREREINYTVMTEEEFTFRKSRRDPFVLSIVTGSRVMIVEMKRNW